MRQKLWCLQASGGCLSRLKLCIFITALHILHDQNEAAIARYGLSWIEPSHEGFNPLKHPWEASGSVDLSWATPSTNYTALGFPRGVKALMRGFYPILGNSDVCIGVGGWLCSSVNQLKLHHLKWANEVITLSKSEQDNGMQQLTWYQNHILLYIQDRTLLATKPSPGLVQHYWEWP